MAHMEILVLLSATKRRVSQLDSIWELILTVLVKQAVFLSTRIR